MTKKALQLLDESPKNYSRALAALRDETRQWWQEQLAREPDDYDKDQTPYCADTTS